MIIGKAFKGMESLTIGTVRAADLIIITTGHANVDYDFVQANAIAIFDTKNAMKNVQKRENIEIL
jgi:UDP-N-acetyl-D-glucosamine dehydrogenase